LGSALNKFLTKGVKHLAEMNSEALNQCSFNETLTATKEVVHRRFSNPSAGGNVAYADSFDALLVDDRDCG
jgi:hypothetical protein